MGKNKIVNMEVVEKICMGIMTFMINEGLSLADQEYVIKFLVKAVDAKEQFMGLKTMSKTMEQLKNLKEDGK